MFGLSLRRIVVFAALLICLVVSAIPAASAVPAARRSIVVLAPGASAAEVNALVEKSGGTSLKHLKGAGALVVMLPDVVAARRLESDSRVAYVEKDDVVSIVGKPTTASRSKQTLPWGVNRIDADLAWATVRGAGIKVGVIDTGIDITHPDLTANLSGGFSAVGYTTSYDDDNGHGTHVAGIVAAADNLTGVVGVAPSARLFGLKALNNQGNGYTSDIIECIDWAIANDLDVVNMSLSGPYYNYAFQDAILRANAANVVVIAAAGNTGPAENTVQYPGAYDGVIAVSATDSSDALASFSSRGPQVDVAAPGASIYSTYWTRTRGAGYSYLSGTSMAAPHVAGVAALLLSSPVGAADSDLDGAWDTMEVEAKLESTAWDAGVVGADDWYGFGIVNAFAASR